MKPSNKYRRVQIKNSDPRIALTLKDELRVLYSGHGSLYSVQETQQIVVKLINLADENIYQQFQQEVLAWSRMREEKPLIQVKQTKEGKYDQYPNIVEVKAAFRTMVKDIEMGVLVEEFCPKGSLEGICSKLPAFALKEIQIMRIMRDILQGLNYLHQRESPLIHRNITLSHVLLGEDNNYKLVNFAHVTTHRYLGVSSDELSYLMSEVRRHTSEGYRAPELIDISSGNQIDERVDIFSAGVILFLLCFGQFPFQGAIATLNSKVEIPDFPKYSANIHSLVSKMLNRDAKNRPSAQKLLQIVLLNWPDLKIQQSRTGLLDQDVFKKQDSEKVKPTIYNQFKKMVTLKLNKRTMGYLLSALEENEEGPQQNYTRLLILKAWEQPNKIEKFYDYFIKFLQKNCYSTLLVMKSLILFHNYVKKGPPDALKTVNMKTTAVQVLRKIIETWQLIDPADNSKDKQRSQYTTKIINMYAQTLKSKLQLYANYSTLMEANFSLKPFFDNLNMNFKSLTPKLIEELQEYMAQLISFSQELLSNNQLYKVQVSLMLSLVDEMNCLLGTLTHLVVVFTIATNYLHPQVNIEKIEIKLKEFHSQFEANFDGAKNFFKKCQTALVSINGSQKKDFIPILDSRLIQQIKNFPVLQKSQEEFNLFQFLNLESVIYGLKIPYSYGSSILASNANRSTDASDLNKKQPLPANVPKFDQQTTSHASQSDWRKNYDFFYQFNTPSNQAVDKSNVNQLQLSNSKEKTQEKQVDIKIEEEEESNQVQQNQDILLIIDPENGNGNNYDDYELENNLAFPLSTKERGSTFQDKFNHSHSQDRPTTILHKRIQQSKRTSHTFKHHAILRAQSNQISDIEKNQVKKQFSIQDSIQNDPQIFFKQPNQNTPSKLQEIEDDKQFDEENPKFSRNSSEKEDDDDDSLFINENNNFYNDILDQDDEQHNFQLGFTNQQLNSLNFNNTNLQENNIPKHLQQMKNMNFINFDEFLRNGQSNSAQQQQQQYQQQQQQQQQYQKKVPIQLIKESKYEVFDNFSYKQGQKVLSSNISACNVPSSQRRANFSGINFQFSTPSNLQKPIGSNKNQEGEQINDTKLGLFGHSNKRSHLYNNQIINNEQYDNQDENNDFFDDFNFVNSSGNVINNSGSNNTDSNGNNVLLGSDEKDINQTKQNTKKNTSPQNAKAIQNPLQNNNNDSNLIQQQKPTPQIQQQNQQQSQQQTLFKQSLLDKYNFSQKKDQKGDALVIPTIQESKKTSPFVQEGDASYQVNQNQDLPLPQQNLQMQFQSPLVLQQFFLESLGSVSSTYSSNNEHLIELKYFIINRVKHDPTQLIIDFKSITFGKKIGSGHSGKVFAGGFNGVEVAIKEMEVNTLNERNQKEFQREIETLVKIQPQINLVSLIGVAQKKDNFYIVTELCNGGTMFELLHKKHSIKVPWLHRIHMCKHIAQGMIYLHSLEPPVIHRDLKSLNLLLDVPYSEDSFEYNIKIADFGLARTESKDEMTSVLGTFHWMAPEVFENKLYTIKADVYSYSIVLWEVICRKTPYHKMSTVDIMKNVCEGKRPTEEFIPPDCPPQLVDLMKDCWNQNSVARPDFKKILERLSLLENQLR